MSKSDYDFRDRPSRRIAVEYKPEDLMVYEDQQSLRPTVTEKIDAHFSLIRDRETRKVVGFKLRKMSEVYSWVGEKLTDDEVAFYRSVGVIPTDTPQ